MVVDPPDGATVVEMGVLGLVAEALSRAICDVLPPAADALPRGTPPSDAANPYVGRSKCGADYAGRLWAGRLELAHAGHRAPILLSHAMPRPTFHSQCLDPVRAHGRKPQDELLR